MACAGRDQWASLDTYALLETAKMDMNADYQPLRGVAKSHFVGPASRAEPGLVASMMDGPYADTVVAGSPTFSGRVAS